VLSLISIVVMAAVSGAVSLVFLYLAHGFAKIR
jgi:hypothetical protein